MHYVRNVVLECLLISAIGLAIGLSANAMYGDGVELGRDYFPRNTQVPPKQPPEQVNHTKPAGGGDEDTLPPKDDNDPLADAVSNLQAQGLLVIRHDAVVEIFEDPRYQKGLFVIIDARSDTSYQAGHVPDAYQWDHYRFKQYIDEVLPVCQAAEKIVVYCNGGDCEDSEFATIDLMDQGIDPGKLFIYPGGITLWKQKDLPVERGERGSGDIVNGLALPGGGHG